MQKKFDLKILSDSFQNVREILKENGEFTEVLLKSNSSNIIHEIATISDSIPLTYCYNLSDSNGIELCKIRINNLFIHSQNNLFLSNLSDSDYRVAFIKKLVNNYGYNTLEIISKTKMIAK